MSGGAATPSYTELVAAIRREGESLLAAAALGLDVWVPTCREWNLEALVEHVSGVYARVHGLVADRATSAPQTPPVVPDGDPLEVLRDQLDHLVGALGECEPDTPVWNWAAGQDDVVAFWARRMAHESSIHRFDAQTAHDLAQPLDAELAPDGLSELLDVVGPRVYERDGVSGPVGTVALASSDSGTWYVELAEGGMTRRAVISSPDVTARATASLLLLAGYGRRPWDWASIEVEGDRSLLERWSACLSF